MATAVSELTYVSFPIVKFVKDADGDLVVYGKATDGSVDTDEQIVDPVWSAKALQEWRDTGGNVRVQHQSRRDPAGKALSIEIDRDGDGGHYVKSLVVEPVAKRLVEKGVLTAYSIGVARPVISRDPSGKARGGIINGGELAELSLVDRPANKNCGLVLAKSADGGSMELVGEMFGEYESADTEDLLTKAGPVPADQGQNPDGGEDAEEPPPNLPAAGEDASTDDPDDDDADAVAKADEPTRTAYKAARRQWLSREPSVKGIAGGTEYLAKRADWMRWHAEGNAEGLGGDRDGAERWLAKRDFTQSQRDAAADTGAAMPDGSFPIKNGEDLDNAIHLAGNAKDPAAARSHIKRRASALGMEDKIPDTWKASGAGEIDSDLDLVKANGAPSSDGDPDASGMKCGTCKGDGKIRGGKMDCPDCKGSGKAAAKDTADTGTTPVEADTAKTGGRTCKGCGKNYHADTDAKFCGGCGKKLPGMGKAAKRAAVEALTATLAKSVEMGMISQAAADEILAQAGTEKAARRPLPGDTKPVGEHREPDGTSTVEQFEPDAGLPTDPDRTPDKVPSSVKTDAPYTVGRMHDMACAAFDTQAVMDSYPSLKAIGAGIDESWFGELAAAAAAAGKTTEAGRLTALVGAAQAVKSMHPAAVEDGRALLHKAFQDMYPTEHIKPGDGVKPGQFQRPYLSGPTASEDATDRGSPNIPPSHHTPEPEQFDRPLITAGHEAESPANTGDNNRVAPGSPSAARTYYSNSSREQARVALQSMHDHIAATFPDLCPMATSKSVLPPDLGARNVPTPHTPPAQGGISTVGKAPDGLTEEQLAKAFKKAIAKYERRNPHTAPETVTQPAAAPGLTADVLKSLLAEQIAPLAERYDTQITELRKQVDELGSKPDPAMAPVRGALARQATTPAVPVERRNLVEEAAEKARTRASIEELSYRAYIEDRAKSSDPGTRERALSVLDKLGAASVPPN